MSDSDSDVEDLMYLLDEIDSGLEIQGNTLVKGVDEPHVVIPEGVEIIRRSAFQNCRKLTSVTFPSTLTTIGEYAFSNCIGLTSVVFPHNLYSIEMSAFYRCTGLTNVVLPYIMYSIDDEVFAHCTGLTSVTLPEGLGSIGNDAFYRCTGLTSVELPNSLHDIGESAFYQCTNLRILVPQCRVYADAFEGCALVLDASGDAIINAVVVDPRIISLKQRLYALWSQNVRRQGRMRQSGKDNMLALSVNMMDYERVQASRESNEVNKLWREIKRILERDLRLRLREVGKFLFAKIFKGGERLVRMQSYLRQPKNTKVFQRVLQDLGIVEPFTESGGEEKEVHIAKRMKRLQLRF